MRKTTLLLTIISIICLSFTSDNLKTYETDKFQVSYPASWTVDDSGLMGTTLFLLSPQKNEKDDFKENCNVIVTDISEYGDFTSEEFAIASKEMIAKMVTNYKSISEFKSKVSGKDAYTFIYTGEQGVYKLKFAQTFLVDNGIVHAITFTAKIDAFDDYKRYFKEILKTYQVK